MLDLGGRLPVLFVCLCFWGGSYTPSGSWITDISIKLIIQIVVSHDPLKSHSANALLHCLNHASTCSKHVKLARH